MKKKLLIAFFCTVLALSLAACSAQSPAAGAGTDDGNQPPAAE